MFPADSWLTDVKTDGVRGLARFSKGPVRPATAYDLRVRIPGIHRFEVAAKARLATRWADAINLTCCDDEIGKVAELR